MPKREDLKSILIIGSGPIIIGQACEFDYSGTQSVKALKEDGYRVILVNSNPATIMTDPTFADATYIEPLTLPYLEEIIAKERPDAILSTMGGQTALNLSLALSETGILAKYGCELIGAKPESICLAEDREAFRVAMDEIGLYSAKSGVAYSMKEAQSIADKIGYPVILRPSRTLGGSGGGVVNSRRELNYKVSRALAESPVKEVLIEESLTGWKEVELEVMRDVEDNCVIICAIENFDPMGVHTGDSITVAPLQTISDKEYQLLRDAAIAIIRKIGVETGGSNVQFAINPKDGRVVVIEMNPRVSRSSALASKATGFPIAKIAAKLSVGYTLGELRNDITRETPACFEPSIDYVVTKIPRFNFEKFPFADPLLGTQMKSVGEVLAFGRNFAESLQKAINSTELNTAGFDKGRDLKDLGFAEVMELISKPKTYRLWYVGEAFRRGASVREIAKVTHIDPWFLAEIEEIIDKEERTTTLKLEELNRESLLDLKLSGFTDSRLSSLLKCSEAAVRNRRHEFGLRPTFHLVDTCAGEFRAFTPYYYSSYERQVSGPSNESLAPEVLKRSEGKKKVIILGSGPNRIGQGIEFDYCCVHGVLSLRENGIEAVIINCNPETVSTDYDISDRLYFEPLTLESVLEIVHREEQNGELLGVVVQFGGQTPLKLTAALEAAKVPILGSPHAAIELAEDRELFSKTVSSLNLKQPPFGLARSIDEAIKVASNLQFPLMIRPSYVLGGRSMRVLYSLREVEQYLLESVSVSESRPVLLDRFLENGVEVDVDLLADGEEVVVAGVMEHIERAGIHSGDSSCAIPPHTLSAAITTELERQGKLLAKALKVVGLLNVQFAVVGNEPYILEANPRASRTLPFISKATGVPWAKRAMEVMLGKKLTELDLGRCSYRELEFSAVKASVFPFSKFHEEDPVLGPEMRSTGEVMGISSNFPESYAKSQLASGINLPLSGRVFFSVRDSDKNHELLKIAKDFLALNFELTATAGTSLWLKEHGISTTLVKKVREGSPHIVDVLGEGKISLVINTPEGSGSTLDSSSIRIVARELKVPCYTTLAAAGAAASGIAALKNGKSVSVRSLQEWNI